MPRRERTRELYVEILASEWDYLNDRVSDLEDMVSALYDLIQGAARAALDVVDGDSE